MILAEANLSFPVHSLTMKRSEEDISPDSKKVTQHRGGALGGGRLREPKPSISFFCALQIGPEGIKCPVALFPFTPPPPAPQFPFWLKAIPYDLLR